MRTYYWSQVGLLALGVCRAGAVRAAVGRQAGAGWAMGAFKLNPMRRFLPEAKPTGLVEAMSVCLSSVCDNLVREAFGVTIPDQM